MPRQFQRRAFSLPGETGHLAAIELGNPDQPVDLVFCHANGFNGRTYASLLAPLAQTLRILAVDMRGHGRTTLAATIEGRPGWSRFGGDLAALLEAQDMRNLVLAGHSMGGIASLLATVAAPQRVRRLVLFDPVMLAPEGGGVSAQALVEGALRRRAAFPDRATAVENYRGRGAFRNWSEAVLRDYVEDGFRDAPDGGVTLACTPAWEASNFSLSRSVDSLDALRGLRCPTRIMRAEHGSTCEITDDPPTAVIVETVPGTTHFLPMERPDIFTEALREATQP